MSLARNPNMPYAVAGRQTQPFERMHVHSNVRVPAAEASVDYDGRMSYSAPNSVRRRREYAGMPMRAAAALVVIAVFILSIFYLSAVSNRSAVYKNRQQIVNDMQSLQKEITELQVEVARARDSSTICYQAAQRLGMVSSQGVKPIEIYAPNTRPANADSSLSAGSVAAWR